MKLSQATLALSKILQNTPESTATGGSTITLIDTARNEAEDYFDLGTIWFLSGTPIDISRVISSWNGTTKTFTFADIGSSVAAGLWYAAAGPDYPRWLLIQKINEALRDLGQPAEDVSLTTVTDQEEYTLPANTYRVLRVELAYNLTSPYEYYKHHNWQEINGKLRFDTGHIPDTSGYKIRLTYLPATTELTADTAAISDRIPLDTLIWKAAVGCLRWRVERTKEDEPEKIRFLNEALQNAQKRLNSFPAPAWVKDDHFARW